MLSIIIPHKPSETNNKALELNISMLLKNTHNDYELIIDTTTPKDPYKIWNEIAETARGDILVFSNSDVLMARNWDIPFVDNITDKSIVTGYIIEPGNIGVAPVNIQRNFGKTPDEFSEMVFQGFVDEFIEYHNMQNICRKERAWYMPCAIKKSFFLETGGFDTTLGFPNPNDIEFFDRCRDKHGSEFLRVSSFSYHFQNLSGRS